MVRQYTWLLDRVGDDGITLTGSGYLPPVHVEAAVAELGMADEWFGKHNRESQTRPVLHLRESAQKMGLLRKHRGKLLATSLGRRLRTDPVGLWWHIAERMPPSSRDRCETHAGLIMLIATAAGATEDVDAILARTLHAMDWMRADGGQRTESDARQTAWDAWSMLRRLGALTGKPHREGERPTPGGTLFAQAALRTWPPRER